MGIFFHLSFFFSLLFAAVIDLLLGLLGVKNLEKASSRRAIFSMEQPGVVAGNFAQFFTQLFEVFCAYLRLHSADHSDLGITDPGSIFFHKKLPLSLPWGA